MSAIYAALRSGVLVAFLAALALAAGSWAVTTRRISPFSRAARLIRAASDPLLLPLERFLVRHGRNPRNAPWWLLGIVMGGGIALLMVSQWVFTTLGALMAAAAAGPRGVARLAVYFAGQLVLLALIVRVVGSWFGAGPYTRWMRPAYLLTDWIVRPLQRFVPPFGMVDITPLIAWLLLQLVLSLILPRL
jgi:YggT family protein